MKLRHPPGIIYLVALMVAGAPWAHQGTLYGHIIHALHMVAGVYLYDREQRRKVDQGKVKSGDLGKYLPHNKVN